MLYQPPINGDTGDDDRPYINGDRINGIEGSIPSAEAIEHPQREIMAVIEGAEIVPDEGNLTQLYQAIVAIVASSAQSRNIGEFFYFVGSTPPANSLSPNGTTGLSRLAYQDFFDYLDGQGLIVDEGTKEVWEFGDGDGATTFSLGDWRGEFIRNFDAGRGADVGRILGSWQEDENKSHDHNAGDDPSDAFEVVAGGSSNRQMTAGSPNYHVDSNPKTQLSGGVEARPRNIALLGCIQYK